ncbi:MAG: alkaline phosphatase D family protein [Pseudomonadota bacterium]
MRLFALAAAAAVATACSTLSGESTLAPAPFADPNAPSGAVRATPMPSATLDANRAISRIAVGSCNDPKRPQGIFDTIAATDPDVFLYIGDNVYGDVRSKDPALPELKAAYMRLAQSAPYARLRASTPVLTTWDDHDYGLNDAGAEFEFKEAAQALYTYVYAIPDGDPRREREGVYHSVMLGEGGRRAQIILLDTRYFRSELTRTDDYGAEGKERYLPSKDENQAMLGDAQWSWLEGELRKPADIRLLITSIQVIAEGHGWEAWRLMPKERARLYALLEDTGADNTILVSGDRHIGGIYAEPEAAGSPLFELTSSSLTLPASRWNPDGEAEPGPKRLGGVVRDANFGLIDIDWDEETIRLGLHGEDGAMILEKRVSFDAVRGG